MCSVTVADALELLSTEHVLFTCYPHPHSKLLPPSCYRSSSQSSPLVVQLGVTFKTGSLLVLQCAVGEVAVFCNFVQPTGGSIYVNSREHT